MISIPYILRDHSRIFEVELKGGILSGEFGTGPIECEVRLLCSLGCEGIVLHKEIEHRIVKVGAIPKVFNRFRLVTK